MDARRGNSKASLLDRELLFLVAKFLESSPCQEAAQVLKRELYDHKLLPSRRNWLGEERQLTYSETQEDNYAHVQNDHLQQLCNKLLSSGTSQPQSLLGSTLLRSLKDQTSPSSSLLLKSTVCASHYHHELSTGFREQPVANICQLIGARQMTVDFSVDSLRGQQLYRSIKKHGSFLGHLAPAFCVLFDHTGKRIITGADDDLLKVWSSETGQLLATLRGHSAEVTDMSLSYDNSMIASGSLDKSVRVWCAQSSASLAVLTGHQSHVTSVQFSPSPVEEYRYLASAGKDGFLFFWQWLPESETFSTTPIKFMEKNRMGDYTLSSAFSPGGKYFVTGGTDHIVRVYLCIPGPPTLQTELDGQHKEKIMTVQFGNTGEGLFATGSEDGTVCIWKFREVGWSNLTLEIPKEECFEAAMEAGKVEKAQVTMVGWEKTDTFLVSATTPDCHIRVWRSATGEHIQTLKRHTGEIFVLESHPSDARILLSAGHDGLVIFWDMLAGVQLKSFLLEWEDGPVCVFDCKFSSDGLKCASVDSYGFLTIMGFGSDELYSKQPMEQFFHTDYRPLMRDRNHYVVDEQTQLPPHLLPPPYLVDIDGHAHPACYQEALLRQVRLVERVRPGRTNEEMEDYDEYMKRHLLKVKQQSFGFGRTRSNFNTSILGSTTSLSNRSSSDRNADGALLSPVRVRQREESATEQITGDVTTAGTSSDAASSTNGNSGVESGEAMDIGGSGDVVVSDSRVVEQQVDSLEEKSCPVSWSERDDGEAGPSGQETITSPTAAVEVSVESDNLERHGLNETGGHRANLETENDKNEDQSSHMPSQDRRFESNEELVAVEHNYSSSSSLGGGHGSGPSQPSNSIQPLPSTSTYHPPPPTVPVVSGVSSSPPQPGGGVYVGDTLRGDNDTGMEPGIRNIPDSDGSSSHWNGIRTRRQLRIGSGSGVPPNGESREQDLRPPERPLDLLRQRSGRGQDEEEVQVNIVDIDEGSQDSQSSQNMLSSLVYSLGLTEHETKQAISLWHNRMIIPPLDPAELGAMWAKRRQLYREEQDNFDEQSRKAKLLRVLSLSSELDSGSKGRSLRSGRMLPESPPPKRVDSIDSEPPMVSESSESEADEWNSDGDSGEDSSDVSDWTAEAGIKFINESRRKRSRRKLSNREEEPSSEEEYGEEEEEEERDDQPGPSKRAEQRKERTTEGLLESGVKREGKPKKRRLPKSLEAYRPPDWILQTKPALSPYLPQVGDIVVYCYQGHQLYIQQVKEDRVYSMKNAKMPWQRYNLSPQEFCQITNVRYTIGPPTLCQITLALLSHSDEPSTSTAKQRITFQIKYHDMDGVLDFLILDSVYKASHVHHWDKGQKFRSLIDGTYWYGTILEKKPFNEDLPGSCWQCYVVEWGDNKDIDSLSPWDMEPLPDESHEDRNDEREDDHDAVRDQADKEMDSQASQLVSASSGSEVEAWGREGEKERILKGFDVISGLAEAYQFREPVNLDVVQDYCTIVAFPTDLLTIKRRLENGFYRRKLALLWEVAILSRNAKTYNEEDSLIVEHARILTETLWKFIHSSDIDDPLQCYNQTPSGEVDEKEVEVRDTDVTFVPPSDATMAEGTTTTRANDAGSSCTKEFQLKMEGSPTPTPWTFPAQELLNMLEKNANSAPFLEPVDTDTYSDYLSYVSCPMDLGTIQQRLLSGDYETPKELISDIDLIFKNAKTYNHRGSEIYKMTLDLQKVFEFHLIPFLKNCPGAETHTYSTRRALGKMSTQTRSSEMRTPSVSSSESITPLSAPHGRRYPKRSQRKSARSDTRSTSRDYHNWSDGEEQNSIADEDDRGRSNSVDVSVSSEDVLTLSYAAPRRQTRSMAKKRGGREVKKATRVPQPSDENGFGMTLRTRGTKRKLEHESGSDESGSEEDEMERDESESDNASLDVEQEEEEEYEEEEEEEEEGEGPEAPLIRTSSRLRSVKVARSPRKRLRRTSDSDEDLTYKPSKFLTRSSRSGRVVKANTKYY